MSVVARGPQLVRHLDDEISRRFTALAREQWDVRTGTTVTALARHGDGVLLHLADGSGPSVLHGDLLLGAHVMGPHATTLIQPLVQALSFGQTVHDVARGQYWIHPALAEVVENALLGLAV